MFVGCNNEFRAINCDKITTTPRAAWLIRRPDGELEYSISFQDPGEAGSLKGVWIDQRGKGLLIDGEVADFVSKCNSCCGDDPEVTPIYNGVFPDVVGPVEKDYTVTRTDGGGTTTNLMKFGLDYQKWIIPNSLYVSSTNVGTGVTTYKFKAYEDPAPQKFTIYGGTPSTDTVTQTALVFSSNVPAALTSGDHYHVEVFADGTRLGTGKDGVADGALSTVVTLLNADPVFNAIGTYALATDKINLTSTAVDSVQIVITNVTP
jgi:hypothetical protein